uniref:Uncharacterized protein n=1 Tax=Rhizophora mucronata TaxID=61149 RepID=A0A2P2QDR2_RHIMU
MADQKKASRMPWISSCEGRQLPVQGGVFSSGGNCLTRGQQQGVKEI